MSTPLSRIRRWHRRSFLPLEAIALVGLLAWFWLANFSPMARLRASGAPTTFEELVAEPIPGAENTQAGLRDLAAQIDAVPVAIYDFDYEQPFTPERLAEAEALLAPHAELIDRIIAVSKRPQSVSVLTAEELADDERLLASVCSPRSVARLLRLQARTELATGRTPKAFAAVVAELRLSEAQQAEPFLTSRLVAVALQTMAIQDAVLLAVEGDLAKPQVAQLAAAIDRLADRSGLSHALTTERVMSLHRLREMPFVAIFQQGEVLRYYELAIQHAETPVDEWGSIRKLAYDGDSTLTEMQAKAIASSFEAEARVAYEAKAALETLAEASTSEP